MGLDTSHDCWHGPYSSFSRWRTAIAEAGGYPSIKVTDRDGFSHDSAKIPWDEIETANPNVYQGEWTAPPADPLFVLIAHSDCDGEIKPEHAGPLADRLEGLLPVLQMRRDEEAEWRIKKTKQFIEGLRAAAASGEAVDFH